MTALDFTHAGELRDYHRNRFVTVTMTMVPIVITVSTGLAIGLAAVLLAGDLLVWRVVAAMFGPERLVTGRHR